MGPWRGGGRRERSGGKVRGFEGRTRRGWSVWDGRGRAGLRGRRLFVDSGVGMLPGRVQGSLFVWIEPKQTFGAAVTHLLSTPEPEKSSGCGSLLRLLLKWLPARRQKIYTFHIYNSISTMCFGNNAKHIAAQQFRQLMSSHSSQEDLTPDSVWR